MKSKPSFADTFRFWLKLGFISFGGPAGQISIMHEELVDRKKWISDSRFLHALNYCMVLPGPEAQQLATYIGWLFYGVLGGLVAGILFILPSVFILIGLSIIYVKFGSVPIIEAVFNGLKPAVVGIIFFAMIRIGKKSLKSYIHYLLAALSFILIFFFDIPFPLILLISVAIGLLLNKAFPAESGSTKEKKNELHSDESDYYISANDPINKKGVQRSFLIKTIAICSLLWIIPFVLLSHYSSMHEFWKPLIIFFTKAAFVTFGGAYAVLPYVSQVAVENFEWLTRTEMMDGLALGETTPGPLIMVLSFVGFMAGYNVAGAGITTGVMGLLITTYYTFLPCFLMIFSGAPIIESTRGHARSAEWLGYITAAVTGVILNLGIYFANAVVIPRQEIDYLNVAWIIISLIMLYRYKVNMILWILISACYGLIRYFIG